MKNICVSQNSNTVSDGGNDEKKKMQPPNRWVGFWILAGCVLGEKIEPPQKVYYWQNVYFIFFRGKYSTSYLADLMLKITINCIDGLDSVYWRAESGADTGEGFSRGVEDHYPPFGRKLLWKLKTASFQGFAAVRLSNMGWNLALGRPSGGAPVSTCECSKPQKVYYWRVELNVIGGKV